MTKVFISYSRKDKALAERLNRALDEINLDSWIDWDDIPPTADWWDQIQKGIESSDGFVFLLSPDSVTSTVCKDEINHAVKNGKRLVPLVAREVNPGDVHPALAKLNWIFFREEDDFASSLKKLQTGIITDLAWVETQRRLQVRAVEWEKRKDGSLLLRGKDLRAAEEQLATAGKNDPQPTDLQRQYVLESRRGESRTRNSILMISAVVTVALALLSVFAFNQRNTAVAKENERATALVDAENQKATAIANEHEALRQAGIARAGELAAQAQINKGKSVALSLLLAVEASRAGPPGELIPAVQQVFRSNLDPLTSIPLPINGIAIGVEPPVFSPDDRWLASSGGNQIRLYDLSKTIGLSEPLILNTESTYPSVLFSPDSRWLVDFSPTHPVFYDLSNPTAATETRFEVDGYKPLDNDYISYPDGFVVSADSKWIVGTSADHALYAWSIDKLPLHVPAIKLDENSDAIRSVSFSSDGRWMIAAYEGGMMKAWEFKNKKPDLPPMSIKKHTQTPLVVRFSQDNKWLVTSDGLETYVWNMENLDSPRAIKGIPPNPLLADDKSTFSPDGHWVATVDASTLWLSKIDAGQIVEFAFPYANANLWGFSSDSTSLAVSDQDGADVIFLFAGTPEQRSYYTGKVKLMLFSPSGRQLVISISEEDGSYSTQLFELHTVGELIIPDGFALTYILDDHFLLTQDPFRDEISVWDLDSVQENNDTGEDPVPTLLNLLLLDDRAAARFSDTIGPPIFSQNGQWMALPAYISIPQPHFTYLLYQIHNGSYQTNTALLDGSALPVDDYYLDIAISNDGKRMAASGNVAGTIVEFVENEKPSIIQIAGITSSISTTGAYRQDSVMFSKNRNWLAAIMMTGDYPDFGVGLWNLDNDKMSSVPDILIPTRYTVNEVFSIKTSAQALAFDEDATKFAVGTFAGYISMYDLGSQDITSSEVLLFMNDEKGIGSGFIATLQFSPNGRWLAAGDTNGVLKIWDLSRSKADFQEYTANIRTNTVYSILFSPDSNWLIVGTKDSSDSGSPFIDPAEERAVLLYDLNATDPLDSPVRLADFSTSVSAMAISPDGKWLAVGNDNATISLWDFENVRSNRVPIIIQYPQESKAANSVFNTRINSLTFSPDSHWLASVQGGEIKMWGLLTPSVPITFEARAYEILFSPDSQYLYSVNGDVQAWLLDSQKLAAWACRAAGRNLTVAEWAQFFPNEEYRVTCTQWPAGE